MDSLQLNSDPAVSAGVSPGVGFGQVVGADIDLVEGEESRAGSTWRKTRKERERKEMHK